MLQLENKLKIVATDLDIIFYDEIADLKIVEEGSTTTSASTLYDILRKIPSNSELNFDLKSNNKVKFKKALTQISIFVYLLIISQLFLMNLKVMNLI